MKIREEIKYIEERQKINSRNIFKRAHWLAKNHMCTMDSYKDRLAEALKQCFVEHREWIKSSQEQLKELYSRLKSMYNVSQASSGEYKWQDPATVANSYNELKYKGD